MFKNRLLHLTFFLTRKCNAHCPFCFYLSKDKKIETTELSLQEIKKISKSFRTLLWLAFSGGEIFLREDIVDITRIFYKNNKPSIILFPTNGLLTQTITEMTENILKSCPRSTIVVKLSIEGTESLHDSIRGSGSFDATMKTYTALATLIDRYPNFELGVNTVFMSKNQDSMNEIIEFVRGMDRIKTHTVSMIRGNIPDEKLKDIDPMKYLKTIETVESNLKKRKTSIYRFKGARLKAAQDILQRRLIHKTIILNRRLIPCFAGRLNVVLTESGDVYPCEEFSASMKMGNIKDAGYDITNVLKTKKAKGVINSIKKSCFCTHECYYMTNILFNPRMFPSLIKEYVQI
jgi:radical SAM protein with 4Fe4S-binding SPASM domain